METRLGKISNILFIGPVPPPTNGQSKCFEVIVRGFEHRAIVADRNVSGYGFIRKTRKYGVAFFKSFFKILFARVDFIYISISRNWLGLFFDAFIIWLGSAFGKEVILHLHGNDFLTKPSQRRFFIRSHSRCSTFVALSEPMKNRIEGLLNCRVEVIVNPIESIFLASKSTHDSSSTNILFFSNVMKSKGISDFIAISKSMCDIPEYVFHIVGKPISDHYNTEEEIIDELNSAVQDSTNLRYHGSMYGKDLSELLTEMDILIFPSFYPVEALPLSVLECAAMGIYPIINDHNDLRAFEELLDHVTITNTKDHTAVKDIILSLRKDHLKESGETNRKRCHEYSENEHIENWKHLLEIHSK